MTTTTEGRNPESGRLDQLSSREIVDLMSREDEHVVAGVRRAAPQIAAVVDAIAERLERGGRLFYFGAGTSGRLGVVDASECPPTFSTDPSMVVGFIAGGDGALRHAVEGAEDSAEGGAQDLAGYDFGPDDVAVGITASGTAPYVIGAVEHAKQKGGFTACIVCNEGSPLAGLVDVAIEAVVGPEVLSGSTRLKAGTATKLVLNMLSTGAMVRLGKCYGNLMVDLQASNAKLKKRSVRIVSIATGLDENEAAEVLARCDGEVKTAIVVGVHGIDVAAARARLAASGGRVRQALGDPQ